MEEFEKLSEEPRNEILEEIGVDRCGFSNILKKYDCKKSAGGGREGTQIHTD